MRAWMIISYWTMFGFAATGCYLSHTETPAGVHDNKIYFGGLVSINKVDTRTAAKECRALLKPGHTGEEPLIDRDVFAPCVRLAMSGIAPAGQHTSPMPADLNGDGRPDVVRYESGLEVPYNLYVGFPGTNWPSVYNYYGYDGMSSGYGTGFGFGAGYGSMMGPVAAPLGPSEYQGSIADPLVAGYLVANARAAATYPEAAKNPQDFARRSDLRVVAHEVHKLSDDIAETDSDLQDDKKRRLKSRRPKGDSK